MDFTTLFQQSASHAWLYLPVAVVLGALHGLEPGHSKTMMAAFIIAVRGTLAQAALLGLSAAISHSLVIWALAALGLHLGNRWNVETAEPYLLIATGIIVTAMALWTIRQLRGEKHHHHHADTKHVDTKNGHWHLSIHEENVPPRFRVEASGVAREEPVALKLVRPGGETEIYSFARKGSLWESREVIAEPHEFEVEVEFRSASGPEKATATFEEHDHHDDGEDHEDEHARQHAEQIRRRFANREVTTPQIVLFGLTGGLMPCPAAFSILLICLQVKQYALGFSVVAAFSIGLALTLIGVGVVAAWGMRHVTAKTGSLGRWASRAPYLSSGLLVFLGLFFIARGVMRIM